MGLFGFFGKPWLRRDYSEKAFTLGLSYLLRRLDPRDRKKVEMQEDERKRAWQQKKVDAVLKDKRKMRQAVRLVLHEKKEQFRIDDGVSRLIAHGQRGDGKIKAYVRVGDW